MAFTYMMPLPGIYHIRDAMGVCMTLLCGKQRALLLDTGYGLEDVSAFVRTLTDRPLIVLLSHCHHDHALGARWFHQTSMFAEDLPVFSRYTGETQRHRILAMAQSAGKSVQGDFLFDAIPNPVPLTEGELTLGGMTAVVRKCPGHTPGSAVVFVPELRLLLTTDTWNPCTWCFFPEALGVRDHLDNARALLSLSFDHVLCSHRDALYRKTDFASFLSAATDDALRAAQHIDIPPYEEIDTCRALFADGQELVFDWNKANLDAK